MDGLLPSAHDLSFVVDQNVGACTDVFLHVGRTLAELFIATRAFAAAVFGPVIDSGTLQMIVLCRSAMRHLTQCWLRLPFPNITQEKLKCPRLPESLLNGFRPLPMPGMHTTWMR
jgi:hypothetical protein